MPRVVCPVCRTGFEANVSRDNCALNCISCGVAFNASHYINKDAAEMKRVNDTASIAETRTRGLPFMVDSNEIEKLNGKNGGEKTAERKMTPLPVVVKENGHPKAQGHAASRPAVTPPPPVPRDKDKNNGMEKLKKITRRPLLEGAFGPWDIENEIARGGVGAVFKAKERATGKIVALKVLLEGEDAGEIERERFRHECETAKSLSLPGMVQVFAVGELEGRPYMAMELVNGKSLDKLIPEKTLSVNDCLVLMKSVAETIGALHDAGYVHRDIKPANILIDAFGSPKVADFGLVKSLDEITRLTASGLVCGTPAYMAPEQARGDGKGVDPRSDVWALGAVLYEMLTCEPPFKAENALRLMLKITKDTPKLPRAMNMKVPQDVQCIVMKCLEKNPTRRYQSARALAGDIAKFLNGEPLDIGQPKVQQIFAAASQNRRSLVTIAGAIATLAVVAIVAHLTFGKVNAAPIVEKGAAALEDRSMSEAQRFDTAERYFREALAIDAKQPRAYLGVGLCSARKAIDLQTRRVVDAKKLSEAVAATNRAAELDPNLSAECCAQTARFKRWLGQHAEEAKDLERAVRLAPAKMEYREALGMAYWHAGTQQSNSVKYYQLAVKEFQGILQVTPQYPKVREYIKMLQERYLVQNSNSAITLTNPRRTQ